MIGSTTPGSTKGGKAKDSKTPQATEPLVADPLAGDSGPATGEEALPAEETGELEVQGVIGDPDDLVKQNPYRYGGYRYDRETQYYYLQARNYDGRLARFLSQDTRLGDVRRPLTLNRYIHGVNSPVNYLDPTGHRECEGAITCDGTGEHPTPEPKAPDIGAQADEALVRGLGFTPEAIWYYSVSRLKTAVVRGVSNDIVVQANAQARNGLLFGMTIDDVARPWETDPLIKELAKGLGILTIDADVAPTTSSSPPQDEDNSAWGFIKGFTKGFVKTAAIAVGVIVVGAVIVALAPVGNRRCRWVWCCCDRVRHVHQLSAAKV